ncbi:MAG TPA: hypothetical protein PKJ08_07005 [Candidatus Cloacimonadota bacterium]|nr:hypothetical protein [Candidatus Cloacimonadota bacterium]HOD54256.1 hypothetical protein [Candidatus Cloacimonadota bacterium]HPM01297.1 hypothetical protein [Candidatus Cloacimonadota bacterium]
MIPRIMAITIKKRNEEALEVQKILTEYGCSIQTRLGLHETYEGCSNMGVILLQLRCDGNTCEELASKLSAIEGVAVNHMELKIS